MLFVSTMLTVPTEVDDPSPMGLRGENAHAMLAAPPALNVMSAEVELTLVPSLKVMVHVVANVETNTKRA